MLGFYVKMVHQLSSPKPLCLALLLYLCSTCCTAAAIRNPSMQSLTQMQNNLTHQFPSCPRKPRPKISLPTDGGQTSYTAPDGLDCLDEGSPHTPECWDILHIDDWLSHWYLKTPDCPPDASSELDCRKQDPPEPWTTTFMRMAMRGGNWNGCSDLASTNCEYRRYQCLFNDDLLLRARYKYVAYTIGNIHQFFYTWSDLMDSTINQAADSISSIISLVDPIEETHTGLRLFLNILTFGLTLLNGLDLGLSTIQSTFVGAVIGAISRAPAVKDALWPKESAESQDIQADKLTDQLQGPNGIHTTLLDNLSVALAAVQGNQTNVSAFLALAAGGRFAVDDIPSPFDSLGSYGIHRSLLQIVTTYLVSEALQKNGWHILVVPGANPLTMDQGTALCPKWAEGTGKYQCDWWDGSTKWFACGSYDRNNMCENYWWYSETHQSAYALVENGKAAGSEGGDFLRTILQSGWSTGPLLLENAAICEFAELISQSATAVTYTSNYNGVAGFFYQGPPFTGYVAVNATTNFVSILGSDTGNAFVAATKNKETLPRIKHPDLVFGFEGPAWHSRCVSQLNTTIANSWAPKTAEWTKNDGH